MLRFWWRTLAYSTFTHSVDRSRVEQMQEQENNLFGSSKTGQGLVTMRLNVGRQLKLLKKGDCLYDKQLNQEIVGPGARYLGYGLMEAFPSTQKGTKAGQLTRPCVEAPLEFVLQISTRDEEALRGVEDALHLFGLVGGLGARSRKGFGSLNLTALEGDGIEPWQSPQTVDDYCDRLRSLLKNAFEYKREPEISAFSHNASVDLMIDDAKSPLDALNRYGEEMVRYRSWGRNGKILDGEASERNFPEDHDWMKGKETQDFHPRRAVFGLPHNYGKNIRVEPRHHNHSRRASPLLFHVHKIGQRYAGIALFLSSHFLPEGEGIRARSKVVPANPDWKVLTDFLDKNRKKVILPDG